MSEFRFKNPAAPRRTLGLLVAAGTLGLVILIAMTILGAQARQARMDDLRAVVLRAQATEAATPAVSADRYYGGDTPQLAQVAMQTDMQAIAETFDIALEVIRADDIEQADGKIRLGLVLNGAVPEANLGGFLAAIGNHERLVILDELSLRAARSTRRNQAQRRIAFQIRLYGYYDA